MHEFSIASAIVESVLSFAEKQHAARVVEVRLILGEFTHIEAEQLKFCFHAISSDTVLADATLEIETSDAAVHCPHCGYKGPPKYWEGALDVALVPTLQCPICGKTVDASEGNECAIKSVKFVRDEEGEPERSAA